MWLMWNVSFVSALCDAAAVGDEDLRHVLELRRIKPVEAHDVPRERRQLVLVVHFLEQIVSQKKKKHLSLLLYGQALRVFTKDLFVAGVINIGSDPLNSTWIIGAKETNRLKSITVNLY